MLNKGCFNFIATRVMYGLTNSYYAVTEVDKISEQQNLSHFLVEEGPNTPVVVITRELEYLGRTIPTTTNQHAPSAQQE